MPDTDSLDHIIADLRSRVRQLGGVKLKKETLSWGPHISFIFNGPNDQTHTSGNVAPTWWTEDHVRLYGYVAELCQEIRPRLNALGAKLPGLIDK